MPTVGKRVLDSLYVHLSAYEQLPSPELRERVKEALAALPSATDYWPNVAKIHLETKRVSLLLYRNFETAPFPELTASWLPSESQQGGRRLRLYLNSANPPVLHRKELLVNADHPDRARWAEITRVAESLGLFDTPRAIGFRLNWQRVICERGYQLRGTQFFPLGNAEYVDESQTQEPHNDTISRHLTALKRQTLSAPVQLLLRHELLQPGETFFDYGCGHGTDVAMLTEDGLIAQGWDPYFAPDAPVVPADVVNLGFVINVIEDPPERVDALKRAFELTKKVLAIAVMLESDTQRGQVYGDGLVTSRRTFQKYFSQAAFREFIEDVLDRNVFMVAPGIAFVFADAAAEQRFLTRRIRKSVAVLRPAPRAVSPGKLVAPEPRRPRVRRSGSDARFESAQSQLEALWALTLELGRWPEPDEYPHAEELVALLGSWNRACRLVRARMDVTALEKSSAQRKDELLMFVVTQVLSRRRPYRTLDPTLQKDLRFFLGGYEAAEKTAHRLLQAAAEPSVILEACREAAASGMGHLDGEESLQLHIDLVPRLPAILRAYIACGLVLWDATSNVHLVKVHIGSGKLSLLEFNDFEGNPLPLLRRRVKINLRKLSYDVYEYGTERFPMPPLLFKGRYLHEDMPGHAMQLEFDDTLADWLPEGSDLNGVTTESLLGLFESRRVEVKGGKFVPSESIPDINAKCGRYLRYRDFIECGETQAASHVPNRPKSAATYNALHALAVNLLDPIIEYFGSIKLTYGVCSRELSNLIRRRVAPRLDQHCSHEVNGKGARICDRDGAACDFLVEYEDMAEVADWVLDNLPFDRMYFYGSSRPLHLSFGPEHNRVAYRMHTDSTGRLFPKPYAGAVRTPEAEP
jgi:DNA phosphorothioation-associated putative methyltransferase